MILSDLMPDTLSRVEELPPPDGPVFWKLTGEVYPQMVYAMFEAALMTGVVQTINVVVPLAAGQNWFLSSIPKGAIAPLRMRAPYPIRKGSLKALDDMIPGWEQETGKQIRSWFPLGVTGFGIYPALEVDQQVVMDFIASPVNVVTPYSGGETVPFQGEFTDFLPQYAAAILRTKEGTAEAEEASQVFQEYLSRMKSLSLFQSRLDALVMSSSYGGRVQTNSRNQV